MMRKLPFLFFLSLFVFSIHCGKDKSPLEPSSTAIDKSDLAQQTHALINSYRNTQGLPSFDFNDDVALVALGHSKNMAAGIVSFSHDGFENRVAAIAAKMQLTSAAENVAYNMGYENPAEIAVQGWLESSGHHKNIVGDSNVTGIGVALNKDGEYYFTQIFIKTN